VLTKSGSQVLPVKTEGRASSPNLQVIFAAGAHRRIQIIEPFLLLRVRHGRNGKGRGEDTGEIVRVLQRLAFERVT